MEATQPPTYEYKCNKHLQQTFNKKWEETNMKKKVLSALLTTAMLASMLVGCGSSNEAPAASTDAAPAASTEAKTEAPASTEAAEPAAAEPDRIYWGPQKQPLPPLHRQYQHPWRCRCRQTKMPETRRLIKKIHRLINYLTLSLPSLRILIYFVFLSNGAKGLPPPV